MSDSDAGGDSLEGSDDDGLLDSDDMLNHMAIGIMQFLPPHFCHNACCYMTEEFCNVQAMKMIVQTMIQNLMMM
jgi:hypothetical protein